MVRAPPGGRGGPGSRGRGGGGPGLLERVRAASGRHGRGGGGPRGRPLRCRCPALPVGQRGRSRPRGHAPPSPSPPGFSRRGRTLPRRPRPLVFRAEAARFLRPRGRVAMIEPWITPSSWVLYRYFHHEDCRLGVDLTRPFGGDDKAALDGNAAIPYLALARVREGRLPLRLLRAEPFIGLPYLVTFGFQVGRPL